MSTTNPSPTLYVRNIDDKVKTSELRAQLYALFSSYGRIQDIRATKGTKMRGQAFLVFADLAGATTAMRACEGIPFYDKPLHIEYARSPSHATIRLQNPNFVSPALAKAKGASAAAVAAASASGSKGKNTGPPPKRPRDDDEQDAERESKREKTDQAGNDDDDEMEIEEDEDAPKAAAAGAAAATGGIQRPPSATLLVTNLPQEITEDMLSVLFQQYQGFQSATVTQSPHPAVVAGATTNAKTKMAQVFYDAADLASTAKDALDGFTVKKGWQIAIQFV